MTKENILKRLSILKLLYKIGVEQSYKGEMTSYFSILSFHDSGEMFLKLATEKNNKKDRSTMLPQKIIHPLKEHLIKVKAIHENDLKNGFGTVYLKLFHKKYV